MQIKIYAIPVMGGEKLMEEMNTFLRTKKILQVEKQFYSTAQAAAWTFCISYLEDSTGVNNEKAKIDYRQVLDAASFERFSKMREIRKRLAAEESLPAYAIFTDEELANLAKIEDLTLAKMKSVKGIGEKKIEKYGRSFLTESHDKKSG
ncbi:HRDC domain-containing protein [Runella sp.]|jgi:superfamily II DNA helicase RecQ|uniref:HRDC domain-containing protein n=1 Tax=Runella sp. TaxID=1960881 RepID=UPI002608C95D|nr:HRDC domain-containing protein [Runella sp.]